jgi:hypothetical protein
MEFILNSSAACAYYKVIKILENPDVTAYGLVPMPKRFELINKSSHFHLAIANEVTAFYKN